MKRLFYVLSLLVAFAAVAVAQETKVYVGFAQYDYEQTKGVNASVQRTAYSYGDLRLEVAADGAVFFKYGDRLYTLQAGPQVSLKLFHDRFNPFARLLFGAGHDGEFYYIYSSGAGADVNVTKKVFIRGGVDRFVFPGGIAYRTTVGGGFRF